MPSIEDVTICLGFYNNAETLPRVLEAAKKQGCEILACDNGSVDKSADIVSSVLVGKPIGTVPHAPGGMYANIPAVRKSLIDQVETEFTFTLDADVVLPDNGIGELLKYWDSLDDKTVGAIGISYAGVIGGHVQMGALLIRSDVAKQLTMDVVGCDCVGVQRDIEAMGLKMLRHPTLKAQHLKSPVSSSFVSVVKSNSSKMDEILTKLDAINKRLDLLTKEEPCPISVG